MFFHFIFRTDWAAVVYSFTLEICICQTNNEERRRLFVVITCKRQWRRQSILYRHETQEEFSGGEKNFVLPLTLLVIKTNTLGTKARLKGFPNLKSLPGRFPTKHFDFQGFICRRVYLCSGLCTLNTGQCRVETIVFGRVERIIISIIRLDILILMIITWDRVYYSIC